MKTLDEHNKEAFKRYITMNESQLNGIACPNCGVELFDSNPNVTLTSLPPQTHIHCEICGYRGTRYC